VFRCPLRLIRGILIISVLTAFSFYDGYYLFADKKTNEKSLADILDETRQQIKIVEFLNEANKRLGEGDYGEAQKYAEMILEINPLNRQAKNILVQIKKLKRKEGRAVRDEAHKRIKERSRIYKDNLIDVLEETRLKIKIVEILNDAYKYIEENEYSRAKKAVDEILKIEPSNREAGQILSRINKLRREEERAAREEARRADKAAREAEVAARKATEDKAMGEREEARRLAEAKREAVRESLIDVLKKARSRIAIVELLNEANRYLEQGDYAGAGEVVDGILKIDPSNKEVLRIASRIDELKREEERAAREETQRSARAKRETERAARRKEAEAAREEARKEAEIKRQAELAEKRKAEAEAEAAREEARKEAEIKRQAELAEKRKAEAEAEAAREEARKEAEIKRQTEFVEKRKTEAEARSERTRRKAGRHIAESMKLLEKGNFSDARGTALKAQRIDRMNPAIPGLIAKIDKEEILYNREQEEIARQKRIRKAEKEAEEDPYRENKGSRTWIEWLQDKWGRKKFKLGKIQTDRVYPIDECVHIALARSPRITVSDKQITLAEIRLWEAYRDLLPEFSVTHEMTTGQIGADGLSRHYRGYKYQLETKYVAFDGMEKWFTMRQAKTNMEIVKLEKKKVVNEVVEDTKEAYYNLDKTTKALDMQHKWKEKINNYYEVTDKSFQEELVSRVEYLKVKAQNLQANFHYLSAGEDIRLAEMVLFQAMNMEPEESIKIKPVERPAETLTLGLENCYDLALANNPEFRIKATVIEYYNMERKMQRAKAWPRVEFHGSFGQSYENYEPLSIQADYEQPNDHSGPVRSGRGLEPQWFAGVKGSIPLWGNTFEYNYVREKWAPTVSAFRGTESATSYFTYNFLDNVEYFSSVQEAKVGHQRAEYEYNKAKQDLIVEVKEQYFQYRKAILQMDIAEAQVEHQQTYVDVLTENQRYGVVEISKVIEEIAKLAEHEYGIISSVAEYYISISGLNKAIGVPDYFRPGYENTEFDEWEKAREDKADKDVKNGSGKKEKEVKEGTP